MNEKNSVILPVNFPQITSWQWHAALFSILGNDDVAQNWLYSNYIQVRSYLEKDANTNNDMLFVDFLPSDNSLKDCPYLISQPITQKQVLTYNEDYLQFLIKSIDLSCYIFGICDETDMLNRGWRVLHQLFIFGYDLDKQVFHVGDFTFNRKFEYTTVPFDLVKDGFLKVKPGEDFVFNFEHKDMCGVYLLSKDVGRKYYEFDGDFVKCSINEYLNCTNTMKHFRQNRNLEEKFIFGNNVYDEIIKQITYLEEGILKRYDYRPFHVLCDHKTLMKNRFQYMMDNKHIPIDQKLLDEYEAVKNIVTITRNGYIRATSRRDLSLLANLKTHLVKAKEIEYGILSRVEKML